MVKSIITKGNGILLRSKQMELVELLLRIMEFTKDNSLMDFLMDLAVLLTLNLTIMKGT